MRKIIILLIIIALFISICVIGFCVFAISKFPLTIVGNHVEFGKSERHVAEDYLKNNNELIEKYGEDYKIEFVRGGSNGELVNGLRSGNALYVYKINDDEYYVILEKKKSSGWHVTKFEQLKEGEEPPKI